MKKTLLLSIAVAAAAIIAFGCGGPEPEAGPSAEQTAAARAKFEAGGEAQSASAADTPSNATQEN